MIVFTSGSSGGEIALEATIGEFYDVAGRVIRTSLALGANQPYGTGRPVRAGEFGLYPSGLGANDVISPTDDALGVMVHKHLWAQCNPGGMLFWIWHQKIYVYDPADADPNHLPEYKNYVQWIEQFPLHHGLYVDAEATCTNASLRVIGQKDLTHHKGHVWVDNAGTSGDLDDEAHNWRTVDAALTPTPQTGDISVDIAAGDYTITPYDTYSGVDGSPFTATSDGTLSWTVSSLSTDTAFRFAPSGGGGGGGGVGSALLLKGLNSPLLLTLGLGPRLTAALGGGPITKGLGRPYLLTKGFGPAAFSGVTGGSLITKGLGSPRMLTKGLAPNDASGSSSASLTAHATLGADGQVVVMATAPLTASAALVAAGEGLPAAVLTASATLAPDGQVDVQATASFTSHAAIRPAYLGQPGGQGNLGRFVALRRFRVSH